MTDTPPPPRLTAQCPEIRTLTEYVDGQLGDVAHCQIDRHLATCPVCRNDVAELFSLITMLARFRAIPERC